MSKIYNTYKTRYYKLLNSKIATKGNIRAFVSMKTGFYERREKSLDSKANHINAFGKAIEELEKATWFSDNSFDQTYLNTLANWRVKNPHHIRKPVNKSLLPPPIPSIHRVNFNGLNIVSLFSGAFGLDLGFLAAGFNLRFATDIDPLSESTINLNLPGIPFILGDFVKVSTPEILDKAGLAAGKVDVLVGGPPCQPFSTAGKRRGFNDPRSSPLKEFIRAIKELKPRAFVMEEVPGLESSRLVHVPIVERGIRPLLPEEEEGSAFHEILNMLASTGYNFTYGKLNACDFGAPQFRERLVFIGLRTGSPDLPSKTHSDTPQDSCQPWTTFWEATADLSTNNSESVSYSEKIGQYMKLVPPGGHWRQLPKELIPAAMGGAYKSGGGKMGFFRKLTWDEPSNTLVTTPLQKGSILGHPEENRPLSIPEYKRIQGFPDDWELPKGTHARYKLIGNAVSVHFSYVLAQHISKLLR